MPKKDRKGAKTRQSSIRNRKSVRNTTQQKRKDARESILKKKRSLIPIHGTPFFTPQIGNFQPDSDSMEVSLYYPGTRENVPLFSVFDNGDPVSKMIDITRARVDRSLGEEVAARGRITSEDKLTRFIEIFIAKEPDGRLSVNVANASADIDQVVESLHFRLLGKQGDRPLENSDFEEGAGNTILEYISYIFSNASCELIFTEITPGTCLKISLDFYKGRPAGDIGLHKDTTHESNTALVALSFDNKRPEFGPELIAMQMDESWKTEREDPETYLRDATQLPELCVLRPILPSSGRGGTVLFHDKLMTHSSPGNMQQLFGTVVKDAVYRVNCDCNPVDEGRVGDRDTRKTYCRLVPSHARKVVPKGTRPDFIRAWIQLHPMRKYNEFVKGDISADKGYLRICDDYMQFYTTVVKTPRFKITNDIYVKTDTKDSFRYMRQHGNEVLCALGRTSDKTHIRAGKQKHSKKKKGKTRSKKK